jgi:hypothetical protein
LSETVCIECCQLFNNYWNFRQQLISNQNQKITATNHYLSILGSSEEIELYEETKDVKLIDVRMSIKDKVSTKTVKEEGKTRGPSTSSHLGEKTSNRRRIKKIESDDEVITFAVVEEEEEEIKPKLEAKKRGRPKKTEAAKTQSHFTIVDVGSILQVDRFYNEDSEWAESDSDYEATSKPARKGAATAPKAPAKKKKAKAASDFIDLTS